MNRLLLVVLTLLLVANEHFMQAQAIHADTSTVSKTVQTTNPDTYKGRQIVVGSGGGFTGFSSAYYLFENGKLFSRRSPDSLFTFIGQQTPATTKRLFRQVESTCKIRKTKFNNPGNLYRFVQWRKDKLNYTVTWGAVGKTVPATYTKFYDSFMALIPVASHAK